MAAKMSAFPRVDVKASSVFSDAKTTISMLTSAPEHSLGVAVLVELMSSQDSPCHLSEKAILRPFN